MGHRYTCQVNGSWSEKDEWMGMGFILLEADEQSAFDSASGAFNSASGAFNTASGAFNSKLCCCVGNDEAQRRAVFDWAEMKLSESAGQDSNSTASLKKRREDEIEEERR
ncbi:hypothetical protein HID58_041033 [Brassica napus]|uniref:Uncharacterized protein n=1 Tax=Brassica napus TaxID=3708 RepID=A0ABQ8B9Q9_BRANA|nr:hypothetical protein HID58_041033 [Brassica napus]